MAEVKRYKVTVNGNETVMKLTAEDAKNYEGATLVDDNSTAEPDTETVEAPEDADTKTAPKPENKARTAQNKGGRADGAAGNK